MRARFWHERWQQNQIGFHQADINPHLQSFWPHLRLPAAAPVLVPLCGKSKDMLWLAAQGHTVLGVELSALAARDFFAENGLQAQLQVQPWQGFECWSAGRISILVGDFFQLQPALINALLAQRMSSQTMLSQTAAQPHIQAVYDRAALIALPPPMRAEYVAHLAQLLDTGVQTLLITLEYEQSITEGQGPPFAVLEPEVRALYGAHCQIESLHLLDVSEQPSGLRSKGVESLFERVYHLRVV